MSYILKGQRLKTIIIYETENGISPLNKWLASIRDPLTVNRIYTRLTRVRSGNLGDTKSVGKGVIELKLNFGSGYRIYYGTQGDDVIVILTGGNKSTQSRDIKMAHYYWHTYIRNNQNG